MSASAEDTTAESAVPQEEAPSGRRPKRARVTVAHYKPEEQKEKTEVTVSSAGSGTALGEIENVNFYLGKLPSTHGLLENFHRLLFGVVGKKTVRKANLRKFCGFENDAAKDKVAQRLSHKVWTAAVLKDLMLLLDQDRSGTKNELVERAIAFLAAPAASGKQSHADAAQEKKARNAKRKEQAAKRAERKKKAAARAKRRKAAKKGPKRVLSAYFRFQNAVRDLVKSEHADWGTTEISTEIGARWRALSEEEKQPYIQEYEEAKAAAAAKTKKRKRRSEEDDEDDDEEEEDTEEEEDEEEEEDKDDDEDEGDEEESDEDDDDDDDYSTQT